MTPKKKKKKETKDKNLLKLCKINYRMVDTHQISLEFWSTLIIGEVIHLGHSVEREQI